MSITAGTAGKRRPEPKRGPGRKRISVQRPCPVRMQLAVSACKIARFLLNRAGRGGTALPGKIAARIDPDILSKTSRGMHVILVTGTNGKTTTCRMLAKACELSGRKCLLNRSGANLLSGITAEFACSADWRGRPRYAQAVVECDEGALKQVAPKVKPEAVVVTNLFRDQLDRYGEVMNTRSQILEGLRLAPESILCLNADCSLTESLSDGLPNRVLRYGLDVPAGEQKDSELSDAKYCIHCGTAYQYRYHTYAHLGSFYCPECGYSRKKTDIAVTDLETAGASFTAQQSISSGQIDPNLRPDAAFSTAQPNLSSGHTGPEPDAKPEGTHIALRIGEKEYQAQAALPAVYNLYNAAAAVCGGTAMGLPAEKLLTAIGGVSAGFGRMETFRIGDVRMQMILVKNPAGCGQTIEYITGGKEEYDLALCLNDKTADGTDISWIWDTGFEKLVCDPHRKTVYISGTRAEDMLLRMKYAGIAEQDAVLEKDPGRLLSCLRKSRRQVYIMPNYTAMLDMRRILQSDAGKGAFWKG